MKIIFVTAKAKGLSYTRIVIVRALRSALIPVDDGGGA